MDVGSWLELSSSGGATNQGWVSESLRRLLKIHRPGPTSELLIGGPGGAGVAAATWI